ncbi:MAG: hypothetical protein KBC22_02370 [Candidatus Pacebacteria bacterium]|nr:hypothetical protein [Candidatus Paceibacterota bacterium]
MKEQINFNEESDRNILFMRHLDEIDDLENFGRDAPLYDSLENRLRIENTANLLAEKIKNNQRRAVIFVVSPRIRAIQTTKMLQEALIERLPESDLKFKISLNDDLRASEQGNFNLPSDYKAGEVFEGLKLAVKIFENENKGATTSGIRNIDYHFGDPVLISPGNYKYPELLNHFTEYGETYRETLTRMFKSILDLGKKYKKLLRDIEVVVVGHGQTYHIIRGLNIIGQKINDNTISLRPGDTIELLWSIYDECPKEEKVPGISAPVDFSLFGDPNIMVLLEKELDYLQNNK